MSLCCVWVFIIMRLEITEEERERASLQRATATTKSQNEPHITMNFNCNPASQPAGQPTTTTAITTSAGNKQKMQKKDCTLNWCLNLCVKIIFNKWNTITASSNILSLTRSAQLSAIVCASVWLIAWAIKRSAAVKPRLWNYVHTHAQRQRQHLATGHKYYGNKVLHHKL